MPVESNSTDQTHPPARTLHLLYHELRPIPARYSYVAGAALFQQHVDLYARLLASASPLAPVLTFDDGHVSNLTLAAPILASRNLTAHFFITAGWTATRPGYMDGAQLRALHQAGHTIGAHGWSHTLLTHCTPAQLEAELTRSRLTLEDRVGVPITTMSLPGGRSNARVFAACRVAGYTHVYTSVPQPEPIPPRFTIGRLNIRGDAQPEWLAQLFAPSSPLLRKLARAHRLKSSAQAILGDRLYARLWAFANRHEPDSDPAAPSDPDHPLRQDPSA